MPSFYFNRVNNFYSEGSTLSARSDARESKTEVSMLKSEVERLLIITEALWTILKKEHGYEDEKLLHHIQDIDLQDGKLDGKVAKVGAPQQCSNCNRKLSKRHFQCLYCGTEMAPEPFER